ncbi:hypothetical protein [Oerskovia enterophila]|uniref:hypothetical protein n=1 Tax=Oerskovia enterophila TaxID=43678 RepID=UPI0037F1BBA2
MITPSAGQRPLDARALVEPVDRSAVLADRSHGPARRSAAVVVVGTLLGVVLGAFALSLVAVTIGVVLTLITQWVYDALDVTPSFALVPWLTVPAAVGVCALLVVGVRRGTAQRRERSYRLSRFAAANGLDFTPETTDLDRPGSIFRIGVDGVVRDVLRTRGPYPVEIGSYTSQENSTRGGSHSWDYLAFPLDRTHPHIVLERRRTRGARGTLAPRRPLRSLDLTLGSGLDEHVRVLGPRAAQDVARQILSVEVVVPLLGAPVSAEIVEDRFYVYSRSPLVTLDPATWEWLLRLVATLSSVLHDGNGRSATEAAHEPPSPMPPPHRGDDRWVVRILLLYPVAATVAILVAALLARG